MKQPSSQSTPLSSASRSPYASFFDLQSVFQCGCTSDVQESRDCEMEHEYLGQTPLRQPLHEESEEIQMESARDYLERISKDLAFVKETETKTASKQYAREVSADSESSIKTVFRMPNSDATVNNQYPFLKHTQSECTQETAAISDDELSLYSEDEEDDYEIPQETFLGPVSILRRKVKLGAIAPSSGSAVTFCSTTVFPDPNAIPQKRKKVKRIQKAQLFVPAHSDQLPIELRRLERRAQQNQYRVQSHRSNFMLPGESIYAFR